jgi:hydrogenase nickel incorporation protein HypB
MCETCGCGSEDFKIHDRNKEGTEHVPVPDHGHHHHDHQHGEAHTHDGVHFHTHEHDGTIHSHEHSHDGVHFHTHEHDGVTHSHEHSHDHGHSHEHSHTPSREVKLNLDILSENNRLAEVNRSFFEAANIKCFNLVSSPGSGKTTILEKTIQALVATSKIFVIEGDQQTLLDANRIEKAGAPAIQINTGSGCHLDAGMVELALDKLHVEPNSILFVENVGNLVCPAMFDLGENKRVVVISVTEGEDKPLKYPYMFQTSNLCLINKSDLLPYVDFDVEKAMGYARSINPELKFILLSAKTGEGMEEWCEWLMC